MNNDEKERKKQWTMMKNSGKMRKHDEKLKEKQWKMMKKRKTNEIRLNIWKKTVKNDEK